jgi:hypothetical protein
MPFIAASGVSRVSTFQAMWVFAFGVFTGVILSVSVLAIGAKVLGTKSRSAVVQAPMSKADAQAIIDDIKGDRTSATT